MPTVSVLLACYRPMWLDEAVTSVLTQTFTDFELLVLDDEASTDTAAYVTGLGDPRIRYLPATGPALGPAGNHDRGLQAATGDWVAIINHDDRWRPGLLAALTGAVAEHPDAVLAFSDHGCIDADGRPLEELADRITAEYGRLGLAAGLHRPFRSLAVVDRAVPAAQSALWRRDAADAIPGWAYGAYDLWLPYRLSRDGRGAVYVPERLADWRDTDDNLSKRPSVRKEWGVTRTLRAIVRDPLMSAETAAVRPVYRRMLRRVLRAVAAERGRTAAAWVRARTDAG